jgi:hypothetical protein
MHSLLRYAGSDRFQPKPALDWPTLENILSPRPAANAIRSQSMERIARRFSDHLQRLELTDK